MDIDQVNHHVEELERELYSEDPAGRRRIRRLERRLERAGRRHANIRAIIVKVLLAAAIGLAAGLVTYSAIVWYSGAVVSAWHSAARDLR
jgi:hypothetical protein